MSLTTESSQLSLKSGIIVDGMDALCSEEMRDGRKFLLKSFYSGTPFQGLVEYVYDASQAKTGHDGWSIINPNHLSTKGSANWYTSNGDSTDDSGNGCLVRDVPDTELWAEEIGITKGTSKSATEKAGNHTALQILLNKSAELKCKGRVGGGYIQIDNPLYFHYDATNNPDYPTSLYPGGRNSLIGQGHGEKTVATLSYNHGTIIENTGGAAVIVGDGSTNSIRNIKVGDISFVGTTTDYVFKVQYIAQNNIFDKIFVWNKGTGGGMLVEDAWVSSFTNIQAYGSGSGIGFVARSNAFASGLSEFRNISSDNWDVAINFGGDTASFGSFNTRVVSSIQGKGSRIGIELGFGFQNSEIHGFYAEGNSEEGLKIWKDARDLKLSSGYMFSNGTNYMTIGSSTAGYEGRVTNITLENVWCTQLGIGKTGINLVSNGESGDISIINPLIGGTDGTGIAVDSSGFDNLSIINPRISGVGTSITNTDQITTYIDGEDHTHRTTHAFHKGIKLPYQFLSGSTTLTTESPRINQILTSTSTLTQTLPTLQGNGDIWMFSKVDSGSGSCIIDANGTEKIGTKNTITLKNRFDTVVLVDGGTRWIVLSLGTQIPNFNTLSEDTVTASASYTQSELQSTMDKIDSVIQALRDANIIGSL